VAADSNRGRITVVRVHYEAEAAASSFNYGQETTKKKLHKSLTNQLLQNWVANLKTGLKMKLDQLQEILKS